MKITEEYILELRQQFLQKQKAIVEIYIPRFCDETELLKSDVISSHSGYIRFMDIIIQKDTSEFNNNIRVVYEAAEVIPYE